MKRAFYLALGISIIVGHFCSASEDVILLTENLILNNAHTTCIAGIIEEQGGIV